MLKPRPNRPKKLPTEKEKPPIEISSDKSLFTFSFSPDRFNKGEKRGHPQTSPDENQNQNQNQNQKPTKKSTKLMPFTAGIPSISFPPLSPEQYLQKALKSLTQAYKGLEENFYRTCNLTKRWRRTSKLTHTHLPVKNNRFSNF